MKNIISAIWKNISTRVWLIVTSVLLVLAIVVSSLASTLLYGTVASFLGGQRIVYADDDSEGMAYQTDEGYEDNKSALAMGNAVNERITDEGMVLLKNENALPLSKGAKISVFGKNSVNLAYGGSGSGGGSTEGAKTIYDSLSAAGFTYNTALKNFYESNKSGSGRPSNPAIENAGVVGLATGETPVANYDASLKASFSEYADAALVVVTRAGGEGWDLPRTMRNTSGARSDSDHYLQLDQNETELLQMVCSSGFEHVIVLVNAANAMELGFLDDPSHYAYNEKIDGAILMGMPGSSGVMSLGRILNGEANPSGHLVDTYVRDLTKDPTYVNFGDNVQNGSSNIYVSGGKNTDYRFVDYEEGIYVGYRYYETRALTDGEEWYKKAVVYPFGYGLSYTSFEYKLNNKTEAETPLDNNLFEVEVEVENTGSVKGKAVVQLYASAPYTSGQIEKSAKTLVGFVKTKILEPGQSETVKIEVDPYYIASYDYNDANGNNFKGYELDAGNYTFYVSKDAHTVVETFTKTLSAGLRYENSTVNAEVTVENLYSDGVTASDYMLESVMTRANWDGSFPTTPTNQSREASEQLIDEIADRTHNDPNASKYTDMPTFGAALPVIDTVTDENGNKTDVYLQLKNLAGADFNDERWEQLLNALTTEEMNNLVLNAAFNTAAIEKIGKPLTTDSDGPVGWVNFMIQGFVQGCAYASECLIAQTWNVDLAYDMGVSVGNESLIGSGSVTYTGWYAPAMNIHRSAFGGRNFEYYSEDCLLSGRMGASVVKGAKSKGVITYIKHFAVNEQETDRDTNGLVTWLTEQSLREIYLRPFEITVKEGETTGVMSSFNRIGARWTGGDYRLLTSILRNEWGFEGAVICDFNMSSYMNTKQMAYAGGDLNLANTPMRTREWSDASSSADMTVLRRCVKNILFATANSNAINREIAGYKMPVWQVVMILVDCAIVVGCSVWGALVIRKALKKKEDNSSVE